MIVKIKSNEHAFTIPVPYAVLHMASGILTSELFHRKLMHWLNRNGEHSGEHLSREHYNSNSSRSAIELMLSLLVNRSTKQAIRRLIKELRRCRGTVLLDVRAQDGTEVLIKL